MQNSSRNVSDYTISEDRRQLIPGQEDNRFTETEIIDRFQGQSPNLGEYGTFRGPEGIIPVATNLHSIPGSIASSSRLNRVKPKRYRLSFLILLGFDVALVMFLSIICYLNHHPQNHTVSSYFTFNLETSVFDLVMVSVIRFVLDFLFYLLLGWITRIVLCITTLLSTIYVPIKAFYYWNELASTDNSNNTVVQYILVLLLLFSAFAVPWLVAFFFEFKYLPTELSRVNVTTWKDYRPWFCPWLLVVKPETVQERSTVSQPTPDNLRPPLPSSSSLGRYQSLDTVFRTPIGSVRASPTGFLIVDDDLEAIREEERRSPSPSPAECDQYSSADDRYKQLGSESLEKLVSLSRSNNGWTLVRTQDGIKCYSLQGESRKIWKSEMVLAVSAERLWTVLYYNVESTREWNSSVGLIEIVKTIDQNTDILYTVCAAIGPITARDFVTVRRWGVIEGVYYDANVSTTHSSRPVQRNMIRGETGPSGYAVVPIESQKCLFIWVLDTDFKGWVPQSIIDQNMSSTIFSTNKNLRTYVTRSLNAQN